VRRVFFSRIAGAARIGGLFFDDLTEGGFDRCFAFVQSAAEHYLLAYQPILARRKGHRTASATRVPAHPPRPLRGVQPHVRPRHRSVYKPAGRIESILASLPPLVAWRYDWKPEPGTPEPSSTKSSCGRATDRLSAAAYVASRSGTEETMSRSANRCARKARGADALNVAPGGEAKLSLAANGFS